jgi:hypothetical protein
MRTNTYTSTEGTQSEVTRKQSKRRALSLSLIGLSIIIASAFIVGEVILPRFGVDAASAANPNCTLLVPANPLTAAGLATPYQLSSTNAAQGPCHEANADQSAFVQAAIIDPATGNISIYNPLVIDRGTTPAVQPTAPQLPSGAVVGIWFGFNGNNLTFLKRHRFQGRNMTLNGGVASGNCVNGLNGSVFGQFAYCNAPAFFTAANTAIQAGKLTPPALQTANDGLPCPTTRDFGVIDQDQSDNVQTKYLVTANGQTAQLTAANQAQLPGATILSNPSDNGLLTNFIDPALGCNAWKAPNLADNGAMVPALPLDELQAAADQKPPVALIPLTDPMVLVNNNPSLAKTNLYRAGVDQPNAASNQDASGTTYCSNFMSVGLPRLSLDEPMTVQAPSPLPAVANSLFTFLAQRFNAAYTILGCQNLINKPNPVAVTTDANGVAISATINPTSNPTTAPTAVSKTPTAATTPTAAATPTAATTPGSKTPTATPTHKKPSPTATP